MADDKSSIERLRKKLYSRSGTGLGAAKRRRLRELSYDVETGWKPEAPPKKIKINKHRVLTITLTLSALFFVGSLAVSAFLFFIDRNTISSENIDIEIQGPATIGGGEELVLQILVTNKNPTELEEVALLVAYPDGTRVPGDLSRELLRSREEIGTLKPGERTQKTVRSILFGEEDSTKEIQVTIEYRVEGSSAIFYREQIYDIRLSNAPLSLSVDSVKEISSGQELELTISMVSNSDTTLEDVLLTAEYPFGFEFISSDPPSSSKNTVWKIGDIKPEEQKTVKIRGNIFGETREERVFRFAAGIASETDDTKLETAFVTMLQPVLVERPFIGVGLAIDGSASSNPVVSRGERVRVDITWTNNLSDKVFDGEIELKLTGDIIDESSISPQQGFYSSADNLAYWNRETNASLGELSAGAAGTVSLSFSLIPLQAGEALRNPTIAFAVTIRGKRVSESNVPEVVESDIERVAKVATDLKLFSAAAYATGPLSNTGPIPPRVEEETTYTVLWTVTNSTNPAGDVVVTASLPSYVRWVGAVSPAGSRVDFNEIGGQVRWDVGTLSAHDSREAAFQVALSPSVSQVGQAPVLVNEQSVRGIDTFTTREVGGSAPALATQNISGEPGFPPSGGVVIE